MPFKSVAAAAAEVRRGARRSCCGAEAEASDAVHGEVRVVNTTWTSLATAAAAAAAPPCPPRGGRMSDCRSARRVAASEYEQHANAPSAGNEKRSKSPSLRLVFLFPPLLFFLQVLGACAVHFGHAPGRVVVLVHFCWPRCAIRKSYDTGRRRGGSAPIWTAPPLFPFAPPPLSLSLSAGYYYEVHQLSQSGINRETTRTRLFFSAGYRVLSAVLVPWWSASISGRGGGDSASRIYLFIKSVDRQSVPAPAPPAGMHAPEVRNQK